MKVHFRMRILVVVLLTGLLMNVFSQSQHRGEPVFSFVVLPIRTDKGSVEVNEHFMDEFIKILKIRGHNAISTRYLGAALVDSRYGPLDACTTITCMTKIVRLVGTRFLIHGSFDSDSMTQEIELRVVDVPNNKEVARHKETFIGDLNSLDDLIPDYADRVLKSVLSTVSIETIRFAVNDTVFQKKDSSRIMTDTTKSKSAEMFDTNSCTPGSSVSVNDLVKFTELAADAVTPGDTFVVVKDSITESSNRQAPSVGITVTELSSDGSESVLDISSGISQVATPKTDIYVTLVDTSVKRDTRDLFGVDSVRRQGKPLHNHNIFKYIRVSGFGGIAVAGLIGGVVANASVKDCLDNENRLWRNYMAADGAQTDKTYSRYMEQTGKTDHEINKRTVFYVVAGLGLAGLTISIIF